MIDLWDSRLEISAIQLPRKERQLYILILQQTAKGNIISVAMFYSSLESRCGLVWDADGMLTLNRHKYIAD